MRSKKEVSDFYSKKYFDLINFAKNKRRRGDGLILSQEEAEDLIGDLLCYHLENPDKFNARYIYNSIFQRRKNVYRDKETGYRASVEVGQRAKANKADDQISLDPSLLLEDVTLNGAIPAEIRQETNLVKREVLSRHFILGEDLHEAVKNVEGSNRMMVERFRVQMIDKYKEEDDAGYS